MFDVVTTRYNKVDLLQVLWDRVLSQVSMKAGLVKDKNAMKMCKEIMQVTKEQRYHILKRFIKACRLMHTVAFMQWRFAFPNKVKFDEEQILELLEEAYHRLYSSPLIVVLSAKTVPVPQSFYQDYDLDNEKHYYVNHFEQIGW